MATLDDFDIGGDDDDFSLGPDFASTGHAPMPPRHDADLFPALDAGAVHDDLLFDDIGAEASHVSPIAALAARPVDELPRSQAAPNGAPIKSALAGLLSMKLDARFKRNKPAATPAALQPPPRSGSSNASDAPAAPALPGVPLLPSGTGILGDGPAQWKPKRGRTAPWTATETARFFNALQQFGTNLSLIAMLFPGRDRTDIVRKLHTEQRNQPQEVNSALDPANERPIDVDAFKTRSHEWARQQMLSRAAPLAAQDADIMRELDATAPPPPTTPTAAPLAGSALDAKLEDDDQGMSIRIFSDEAASSMGAPAGSAPAVADDEVDDTPFILRPEYVAAANDDGADDTPFAQRPEYVAGVRGRSGAEQLEQPAPAKKARKERARREDSAAAQPPASDLQVADLGFDVDPEFVHDDVGTMEGLDLMAAGSFEFAV
jgi:hypothetical protein